MDAGLKKGVCLFSRALETTSAADHSIYAGFHIGLGFHLSSP